MSSSYAILVAFVLAFLLATAIKWQRRRPRTNGGFESDRAGGSAARAWDVVWDVIQKLSAVLGLLTIVLKHVFGIEI